MEGLCFQTLLTGSASPSKADATSRESISTDYANPVSLLNEYSPTIQSSKGSSPLHTQSIIGSGGLNPNSDKLVDLEHAKSISHEQEFLTESNLRKNTGIFSLKSVKSGEFLESFYSSLFFAPFALLP
ncbi:unnamed protein product [Protopolystoma xenopodis]|uniref:Uncharacterized protein n=1 Tax=Protopolystoma xenopodis TaxID=117903 RepID=A0A448WK46_9PLAT|nr:unnamed protein product [Protopolystoma xenopodis]